MLGWQIKKRMYFAVVLEEKSNGSGFLLGHFDHMRNKISRSNWKIKWSFTIISSIWGGPQMSPKLHTILFVLLVEM